MASPRSPNKDRRQDNNMEGECHPRQAAQNLAPGAMAPCNVFPKTSQTKQSMNVNSQFHNLAISSAFRLEGLLYLESINKRHPKWPELHRATFCQTVFKAETRREPVKPHIYMRRRSRRIPFKASFREPNIYIYIYTYT